MKTDSAENVLEFTEFNNEQDISIMKVNISPLFPSHMVYIPKANKLLP